MLATCIGGYLSAGGAAALQHVHRPRHRRADGPHVPASAGHRHGLARASAWSSASPSRSSPRPGSGSSSTRCRRCCRSVRCSSTSSSTRCSSSGVPPEHRLGRDRGLYAGLHRLVRGHEFGLLGRGGPLPRHLLLDAAALLAAVDEGQGRLRAGRRADAAGRRGQQGRRPADRRSTAG